MILIGLSGWTGSLTCFPTPLLSLQPQNRETERGKARQGFRDDLKGTEGCSCEKALSGWTDSRIWFPTPSLFPCFVVLIQPSTSH